MEEFSLTSTPRQPALPGPGKSPITGESPTGQAGHGQADPSEQKNGVRAFSLNHPKNYLGVVLAAATNQPTDAVIEQCLTSMTNRARSGAAELGLIRDGELTPLGERIVHVVTDETTLTRELQRFEGMAGSTERFIKAAPRWWTPLTRYVCQQHGPTANVVTLLEQTGPTSLANLGEFAIRHDHPVKEHLLRNPSDISAGDMPELTSPDIYAGQAVYQFKTLLFHCGILTERGKDTSVLEPQSDHWALEPTLISLGGES